MHEKIYHHLVSKLVTRGGHFFYIHLEICTNTWNIFSMFHIGYQREANGSFFFLVSPQVGDTVHPRNLHVSHGHKLREQIRILNAVSNFPIYVELRL